MTRDFIHTSESVTAGHPDKLCDQISDAIVDRFLEDDPKARVSAECALSLSVVFIAARFSSQVKVDFPNVARKVIRRIGYVDDEFNYKTCSILTSLKEMDPKDRGEDEGEKSKDDNDSLTVSDQVTLFGFACDQTESMIPLPLWLAHRFARRLSDVRQEGLLPYLAPDGTTQVGIEFKDRRPHRIHTVAINCSQRDKKYPQASKLRDDIMDAVIAHVLKDEPLGLDPATRVLINHGGPLKMGGPSVHSGLTGRKNAIDTYGGYARNSGSALSGKDPLRIDRVGAYAARYAARNVVAAGLAKECEVLLSYAIGLPGPVSVQVDAKGTSTVPEEEIAALVDRFFDFRLSSIVKGFDLQNLPARWKKGFYRELAAYGHFGRPDLDLPWERTDMAEKLRER
jgi:S-adenosylmethionine synthetase